MINMKTIAFIASLLNISFFAPAYSDQTLLAFEDPSKQALYLRLTKELRCLVCQNQNLADSNADLAKDLRNRTYEMVDQDNSYEEIIDFMVTRYGDFVLYRPPFKSSTLILWASPFLLIILITTAILRKRKIEIAKPVSDTGISEAKKLIADTLDKN